MCALRWVFTTQHLFFHLTFHLLWTGLWDLLHMTMSNPALSFWRAFMVFWVNTNSSQSNFLVCILCNSFHSNFSFRKILCCISHLPSLPFPIKSWKGSFITNIREKNSVSLPCACPFCICFTSNSLFRRLNESQCLKLDSLYSNLLLKAGPTWTGCSWPCHKVVCARPLYMKWHLLVS